MLISNNILKLLLVKFLIVVVLDNFYEFVGRQKRYCNWCCQ